VTIRSLILVLLAWPASALPADAPVADATARELIEAGEPFGRLPLVDEVVCGSALDRHPFRESAREVSDVGTVLGRSCRVMPPGTYPRWFAYRIGQGKGLQARAAYLLEIEFPDDGARTMIVVNRGCDMFRGIATGGALGDALWGAANSNAESIDRVPHARKYLTQKLFFFLNDRTADLVLARQGMKRPLKAEDGFWVAILAPRAMDDPLSRGAAVARIRLFEAGDPAAWALEPRLPEGLPHRRVFAREELSVALAEGENEAEPALDNADALFEHRAEQARFLGMNAIAPDVLARGRNQGWDAGDDEWYEPPRDPLRWEKMLQIFDRYGLEAVPYFEYPGSPGLNRQVRCRTLSRGEGQAYTKDAEDERWHLDVTAPESLEDAKHLLERTVMRFRDRFRFAAVWFRTRQGNWPVSYSDAAIARFAADANGNWPPPREQFAKDRELRGRYEAWWLGERLEFLSGIRDFVRKGLPAAEVLFTPWPGEAGPPLSTRTTLVVTDVPSDFRGGIDGPGGDRAEAVSLRRVVGEEEHLKATQAFPRDWGGWESHNATPPADPDRYRWTAGIMLTYPFNRVYTVLSSTAFEAYRGPDGLATVRFSPLNEHVDRGGLGYVVADVDRAGPFCMIAEALAVANGDPFLLGYLASNTFTSGFPEYFRRFAAAFLALPALKSERKPELSPDPEVVVRVIWTKDKGTYLAVVNTGVAAKQDVLVTLPWDGQVTNAVSGQILDSLKAKDKAGKPAVQVTLGPCELTSLRITWVEGVSNPAPAPAPPDSEGGKEE